MPSSPESTTARHTSSIWLILVAAAAVVGMILLLDSIRWSSATYDEAVLPAVAAHWWRSGEQATITRHGLATHILEAPAGARIVDARTAGPSRADRRPDWPSAGIAATGSRRLALDLAGSFWLCAAWSRRLYGPRAMALAAWLFALSPNLIAHGGLVTMELPLLASTPPCSFCSGPTWKPAVDAGSGLRGLGGPAFSCKFTTVLFPPILGVIWWLDGWRRDGWRGLFQVTRQVALGMAGYVLVLLLADLAITGFAVLTPSRSTGDHPTINALFGGVLAGWIASLYETPVPQDWVGLANQVHHQMSGGASYLLGETRMTGWRYYYFVALAVKLPLTFWLLLAARVALAWRRERGDRPGDFFLPLAIGLFLAITAIGSTRNYGSRYLLPLAPLAIVWISRIAQDVPDKSGIVAAWPRWLIGLALAGQAAAIAAVHPYELTYFNVLAGGPLGGATSCPTRTSTGARGSSAWPVCNARIRSFAT